MDESGASIVEIMATLVIVSTLIMTGVPHTSELWRTFEGSKALKQFILNVRRSRVEAIAAGTRGVLSVDLDANGFSFGIDAPPYSNPALGDSVLFHQNLGRSILLNTSQDLIFDSRGFLVDEDGQPSNASFSISIKGEPFASGTISTSGRVDLN